MSEARMIVGDVFEVLASMPDASVDLVLTSPPFLALRSYLPADHPDKGKEIGSEPTPGAFIDTLLALSEEWARVLTPHGSLCVELGDTYSGSGGAGGDYNADGLRDGQAKFDGSARRTRARNDGGQYGYYPQGGTKHNHDERPITGGRGWPLAKSLCLIPELYRVSLVYGFNPLTGRETPPWRARNVVRWCRPNPPVGALGDKFRPGTSDMVVACKSARRWFDLDAVREPHQSPPHSVGSAMVNGQPRGETVGVSNPNGAPPLDWWNISTQPYRGSHYATWPEQLCRRPILAMCPPKVCRVCGKPSERITGDAEYHQSPNAHGSGRAADDVAARGWQSGIASGRNQSADLHDGGVVRVAPTLGWTDCGHDDYRTGVVLDPFAGSGTTLAVAVANGRDAIGIDLDARNLDLARERCGMFLNVDEPTVDLELPA